MNKNQYSYYIKTDDNNHWNNTLADFADANIYQTIEFNRLSIGGENIEQFYVENNKELIAAALVRIKLLPIINRGVAYIRWAPMWVKESFLKDTENFRTALQFLNEEYVVKRKLVLRIIFGCSEEHNPILQKIVDEYGFKIFKAKSKSVQIDLLQTEETIRKNFNSKWRYSLRKGEKNNLVIEKTDSDDAFKIFISIYKEMHSRKNFIEYVDVETFRKINTNLHEDLKCKVFLCKKNSEVISAMVVTAIGNSGIYLLGGSTITGLKAGASFLLQWEVIKWLKSEGLEYYDLGGVDKVENPGVHNFKSSMGGKEITYLGAFEKSNSFLSSKIVQLGEYLKKR